MAERVKKKADYEVSAVRKALQILCAFDAETPSLTVSHVSRQLALPKSTAHNLLRTLQSLEFVKQDAKSKSFRLGPRVFELGRLYSQNTQLIAKALPYMRRLADQIKETVKLATISGAELLVLEAIESPYQLHTRGDVGQRAPLYCTGLGKALLASIPEQDIRELVARRGLAPYTARTITSLERLEQEVAQIRINGYALDREENEEGVCCVGVQIRDLSGQTIAAMSISGPTTRLTEQTIPECASLLAAAAKAISQSLR